MPHTDMALLDRWMTTHDPEAFAEMVSRHSAMVYATCKRVLGNAADAEEVAQDCFLKLAQAQAPPKSSLAGWLHTLATHRSINRIKADARRREREIRYVTKGNGEETGTVPDERSEAELSPLPSDDVMAHVDEAIAALPKRLRHPIIAHFLEGQTHEAIARTVGVSQSTITRRIHKGIVGIRKSLERRGVPISFSGVAALLAPIPRETVPPTFVAALGKIALAAAGKPGTAVPTGALVSGAAATFMGGLIAMKKAIAVACLVLLAGVAAWHVLRQESGKPDDLAEPVGTPREQASDAGAPLRDAADALVEQEDVIQVEPAPAETLESSVTTVEGAVVSGRVVGADGRPVEGAEVVARIAQVVGEYRESHREVTLSGAEGQFELHGLLPTKHLCLLATASGLASPPEGPLTVTKEGLTHLELTMFATGSISGHVFYVQGDSWGEPAAGAHVGARLESECEFHTPPVESDGSGAFVLVGLAPGTYETLVGRPTSGYSFVLRPVEAVSPIHVGVGELVTGITLPLLAGHFTLSGRITDTAGKPVAGAQVEIHGYDVDSAVTNADGLYEFTGLSEGTYGFHVACSGYGTVEVEQVDSGSGGLDIVLERRAVVEGRVLRADTGEPVTDFELAHRDASRNRFVPTRFHTPVQDEQGRFRLELGPTRDAVVLARAKGFAEGSARTGELMEGKTVTGIEIRLEPAIRVEGVVRNRAGEPIAGALVFAGGVREALRLAHEQGVRSSDDGAFVLELDSSKTRHISATHPSYAPGSVEVRLSASGANQVKIVLSEGGTIEGTVFSDGRPVAYQEVHVYHRSGSKTEPETRTDADGRYRVTCVMPGERRVSAGFRNRDRPESRYRHMDQYGVVEEGRVTVVDFDFPPATATLELTIRVEGETPEQATARVSGAVETSSGVESLGFTASDSDGVCTIEDVPSGTVTLEVRARHADGGKLTETVTLEVADGETISRQIDLE